MHALINEQDQVVDLVVWDGGPGWAPPEGLTAVPVPSDRVAVIGGTFAGGVFNAPPVPSASVDERKAALAAAVQAHLDATAKGMGYDDIRSAVTYAEEPAVPKFQAEGRALRAWRSEVWAACYGLLARWAAGEVSEPSAADVLAALPAFPGVATA